MWTWLRERINWWVLILTALATALALNLMLRINEGLRHESISPVPIGRDINEISQISDLNAAVQWQFINNVLYGAQQTELRFGIPSSLSIAQSALESNWGRSALARKARNVMGIKAGSATWRAQFPTRENRQGALVAERANFALYESYEECFEDYGLILSTKPAYRKVMLVRSNPEAMADALTGVWATDPQYGAKVKSIMKKYYLARFNLNKKGQTNAK